MDAYLLTFLAYLDGLCMQLLGVDADEAAADRARLLRYRDEVLAWGSNQENASKTIDGTGPANTPPAAAPRALANATLMTVPIYTGGRQSPAAGGKDTGRPSSLMVRLRILIMRLWLALYASPVTVIFLYIVPPACISA
jgi:hypothetical protein